MNYILDFKNDVSDEQISNYLSQNNIVVIKTFSHFTKVFLAQTEIIPPKTDIVDHVIEDHDKGISLLETVDIIQPNKTPSMLNLGDDKNWWKVASLDNVNFESDSQLINRLGSRVTVYLMDSGVNIAHSEFTNNRVQNLFSFTGDFTDTKGHGTALASVITGNECGISNAIVKSVKIFDVNIATKQSDLLSAFDSVALDYLQNEQQPSIINLSWGIAKNEYIENKINYLISLGLVVVCAAGNSGISISDVTPASMFNVIKIGAFNQNFEPCDFSNYVSASHISVTPNTINYSDSTEQPFGWAPGEMIYSATKDNSFGFSAGTSIACAISVGTLAHNMDFYLTNDGNFTNFSAQQNYVIKHYEHMMFSRHNILNLSSQYASTSNRINTFITKVDIADIDEQLQELRLIRLYNMYFKVKICDENSYDKITYDDLSQISPNIRIDNGFFYGVINEPVEAVDTLAKQFIIPVVLSGPNKSNYNLTITLTVGKTYEDISNANVSSSSVDPTIAIVLYNDECCTWNGTTCVDAGGPFPVDCCQNCADVCGSVPYQCGCTGGSKAACSCYCKCQSTTASFNPCPP